VTKNVERSSLAESPRLWSDSSKFDPLHAQLHRQTEHWSNWLEIKPMLNRVLGVANE
jgi:hypothetical protein